VFCARQRGQAVPRCALCPRKARAARGIMGQALKGRGASSACAARWRERRARSCQHLARGAAECPEHQANAARRTELGSSAHAGQRVCSWKQLAVAMVAGCKQLMHYSTK